VAASKKILIVEDNAKDRRLMKILLGTLGCELLEAADGEAGLAMAQNLRPDLIITDIRLPKLDGLELIQRLRNTKGFEQMPIIAVTAYAMPQDKEMILAAGCTAYFTKPLSTKSFAQEVKTYLSIV